MAKNYRLPKKAASPAHFWIQTADSDGLILESKRSLITFAAAKQRAAKAVREGVHTALIIHGSANPNSPHPDAVLASFCEEQLEGHRKYGS